MSLASLPRRNSFFRCCCFLILTMEIFTMATHANETKQKPKDKENIKMCQRNTSVLLWWSNAFVMAFWISFACSPAFAAYFKCQFLVDVHLKKTKIGIRPVDRPVLVGSDAAVATYQCTALYCVQPLHVTCLLRATVFNVYLKRSEAVLDTFVTRV